MVAVVITWLIAGSKAPQPTNSPKSTPPANQLVFRDEFNTSTLDSSHWSTCYEWFRADYNGCSNNANQELQWYMPGQVSVGNGHLTLKAIEQSVEGWNGDANQQQTYPYRSGMISSGRPSWEAAVKASYRYGYFEARIKVSSGQGIWPAFWLLPIDKTWPPEIDVMEILGHKPKEVLMTYHWGETVAPQKNQTIYRKLRSPNDWHTYAIDWQPDRIDWYIDGVKRKSLTGDHLPSEAMAILFNLAVGGKLPGSPNELTPFPATMQIDYIRVYRNS